MINMRFRVDIDIDLDEVNMDVIEVKVKDEVKDPADVLISVADLGDDKTKPKPMGIFGVNLKEKGQ